MATWRGTQGKKKGSRVGLHTYIVALFFCPNAEHMNTWSIKETAEYLKRSEGSIRKLILRKAIPFRKPGGRIVFCEEEIKAWVNAAPGVKLSDLEK